MTNVEIKETAEGMEAVLSGRLDTASAHQFAIDIQPLMDNADKRLLLDCADLSFVSSSGLRLFLLLRKETIAKGGKVVIKDIQPSVKQVFAMTGFMALFELI